MLEYFKSNLYSNKETLESLSKLTHQSAWLEMRIDDLEEVINNPRFEETDVDRNVGEWWEVFRNIDRE